MDYVGATDNETGILNDGYKYTPETFNPVTMAQQDVSGFARDAYDSSRIRQQSANDLTRQRMQSSGGMSAGDLMALNQGGAKQRAKLRGKANMWGDIMQDRTNTDVANYNSQLGNMADIFNAEQIQAANIFNTGNTVLDAKNRWEFQQKMIETEGKLKYGQDVSEIY